MLSQQGHELVRGNAQINHGNDSSTQFAFSAPNKETF